MSFPTIAETHAFVSKKFDGVTDSQGVPMYSHMIRVSQKVPQDYEHVTTALLHDTVEDTDVTLNELMDMGYPMEVVEAVALLTHNKKEMTYPEYIDRLITSGNTLALRVKISDQYDNTNPSRWLGMNPHMARNLSKKWAGVLPRLEEALRKWT